jgi:hypothetical protein
VPGTQLLCLKTDRRPQPVNPGKAIPLVPVPRYQSLSLLLEPAVPWTPHRMLQVMDVRVNKIGDAQSEPTTVETRQLNALTVALRY